MSDSAGKLSVITEPGASYPVAQIGRILAYRFGTHPSDAIAAVRYGMGVLVEHITPADAEAVCSNLDDIGVAAHIVPSTSLAIDRAPRGIRAHAIERDAGGIIVRMVGGRRVPIASRHLRAIELYALAADDVPGGDEVTRKQFREEKRDSSSLLARPVSESVEDALLGRGLSPRGQNFRDAIVEARLPELRLHLTLFASSPFGPIRMRKDDFDFSCLDRQLQSHSIDNFLLLTEEVLAAVPRDAWGRDTVESFLTTLDPRPIHRAKPEEVTNRQRWLLYWIRARYGDDGAKRALRGGAANAADERSR